MQSAVTVKDKKSFIKWFLNHYQLKKRESVWILNYLVNHHEILANVHFVHEAKFCPRGIIMTSHCSTETPFRFYKNQLVTTDAEKSFHDIRLNQHEPLYLQLNFNKSYQCPYYVAVLEENPFLPDEYFITEKDKNQAKCLLNKTLFENKRKTLLQGIDEALDRRDYDTFQRLTSDLKKLEAVNDFQPKLQEQ
ncbi:ReoY family proteolytic degradation factor [Virgibacillus oceani]